MGKIFDLQYTKISKWQEIFLWFLPTQKITDSAYAKGNKCTLYVKKWFGKIYIIGEKVI